MNALFDYGVLTEQSDIRAHVSPLNREIYVFQTRNFIDAYLAHPEAPCRKASQPGCNFPTATGALIKTQWINDLRTIKFHSWPRWPEFNESMSTSGKGRFAVDAVISCMEKGRFPIWLVAAESADNDIQIKGTDILIWMNKKIQVKCDAPAARPGNLFFQLSERNPLNHH